MLRLAIQMPMPSPGSPMASATVATYHIGTMNVPMMRKIAAKIRPRMLTTCPPRAGHEPVGITQQPAPPQQLPMMTLKIWCFSTLLAHFKDGGPITANDAFIF